jgi:hypothetical protein
MSTDRSRRLFLGSSAAAAAAAVALPRRVGAQTGRVFTPEMFGAKGDGITNDSLAFSMLGKAVTAAGGGVVSLRRKTYLVGLQVQGIDPQNLYYFSPAKLLVFEGCPRPVVVQGNGAKLKCADGLKYGTFDMQGRPARHTAPYIGPGIASPYEYMIRASNCSGGIEIADLELDGNLANLVLGGSYGDSGRQIPAGGIILLDNSGPELIRNVYSHHHALDGLVINGVDAALPRLPQRLIEHFRSEYNGRQGVSIVGGRGYALRNCAFNHTGRAGIGSGPGAGVDIEAEGGKKNRDFSFADCEFVNNLGCGLVADVGDSEGATFTRCSFVGTTAWAAWPLKPDFRFTDCRFVGSVCNAYGDTNPERAVHFINCTFLDDPKLSPTGKVCLGGGAIVELSNGRNVLFRNCTFRLTDKGRLPWSWFALYDTCRMQQVSKETAYPKGKYFGASSIDGPVDLYGTKVVGVLTLNGRRFSGMTFGEVNW